MGCNPGLAEATALGAVVVLQRIFTCLAENVFRVSGQIYTNEESAIAVKHSLSHMCYCAARRGSQILRMEDGAT